MKQADWLKLALVVLFFVFVWLVFNSSWYESLPDDSRTEAACTVSWSNGRCASWSDDPAVQEGVREAVRCIEAGPEVCPEGWDTE